MTDEAGPRDELRAAVDGLTDTQSRTLLAWARTFGRDKKTSVAEGSVGALGDALGIVCEVREPGRSRMRLEVDPAWHNPHGVLHGGVIYTLVDSSMGIAVKPSLPEDELCTTIEAKISYLAPVREGTLTVETEVVRQGRNIAFTESKVTDSTGKLVATGSGSMFILRPDEKG